MKLRCKPGDLAVVIDARLPSNLGRIVKVLRLHDGSGDLRYPPLTPCWLVSSSYPMSWVLEGKRFRRKKGPVPDCQLQPLRKPPLGSDIANGVIKKQRAKTSTTKLLANFPLEQQEKED